MDVADITPHLDHLDGDLDKLEDALKPLLTNLGEVASKLPLMDKAKLYVLATYSIETALFSALRLNGTDAKSHPVFKELTRVRQYYEKIKKAEEPAAEQRKQTVDMQAAIRFVKADLADDKGVNTKLKELLAKERAKAAIRAARDEKSKKRPAEDFDAAAKAASAGTSSKAESVVVNSSAEEPEEPKDPGKKKAKRSKGEKKPKQGKR